jgi:tetratricopeptide (TPR) repeat protein
MNAFNNNERRLINLVSELAGEDNKERREELVKEIRTLTDDPRGFLEIIAAEDSEYLRYRYLDFFETEALESLKKDKNLYQLNLIDWIIQYQIRVSQSIPASPSEWVDSGNIFLFQLRKCKEAIEEYDKALELDSKYLSAWLHKGIALGDLGHYTDALHCFEKSIEIDSSCGDAWNDKGIALCKLRRFNESIPCFEQAFQSYLIGHNLTHEDHISASEYGLTTALTYEGLSLIDLDRPSDAIEIFDQALRIDPKCLNALNWKSWSMEILGDHEEAFRLLEQAFQIDPSNELTMKIKGEILRKTARLFEPEAEQELIGLLLPQATIERFEEAIQCFDQVLQSSPNDEFALNAKGQILIELNRIEEALECLHLLLQINPNNADASFNKGVALSLTGCLEEAFQCLENACIKNEHNSEIWEEMGHILEQQGFDKEASQYYDRASFERYFWDYCYREFRKSGTLLNKQ